MRKIWVVNASPLILLGRIHAAHLLLDLSEALVIPEAVAREVGVKPDGVRILETLRNHGCSILDEPIAVPSSIAVWDLGRGESEVLSQAVGLNGSAAVLDDLQGRRCAQAFGVPVIGTLGVVVRARRCGLIEDASGMVGRLREAGLFVSDALAREVHMLVEALDNQDR